MKLPRMPVPETPLYQCLDCLRRADDYIVHDCVWWEAFGFPPDQPMRSANKPKGHLCFECLKARLRRPLQLVDFRLELPINRGILLGAQLYYSKLLTDGTLVSQETFDKIMDDNDIEPNEALRKLLSK